MDKTFSLKPKLLLDVDGVLNAYAFGARGEELLVDGFHVCFPEGVREHLGVLQRHFHVLWATAWEHDANRFIAPLLGLPRLDVVEFSGNNGSFNGQLGWKLSSIDERFPESEPLAWIDDDFDEECFLWAETRAAATLLVRTSPASGLVDEHVRDLLAWSRSVGAALD